MPNPLSAITAGSLRDLGYVGDQTAFEPYTISSSVVAPGSAGAREEPINWAKAERLRGPWMEIDPSGRIKLIGPRPPDW